MSYIIPSSWVWAGPVNMMNVTPVIRLYNMAKIMKTLITRLGYIRLHFSRQGERFSCWPWRSKLPCCELPMEGATWQGAEGSLWEPRVSCPTASKKMETSIITLLGAEFCQHLKELGSTIFPRASSWEGRLANTLGIPKQKTLPRLWPTDTIRQRLGLFKTSVYSNLLAAIEKKHISMWETEAQKI